MEQFLISIVNLFAEEEFRHWFFWTALILGIFAGWSPFGFWRGIYKIVNRRRRSTSTGFTTTHTHRGRDPEETY